MNLKLEYETELDKLDLYPKQFRPTCYILGLIGESIEFFEKYRDNRTDKQDLMKELGDIIWYVTRLANYLNFDTQRLLKEARARHQETRVTQNQIITVITNIGKIAELQKKAIRDKNANLDESDTINIKFKLINIIEAIDKICDTYEITYEEIAMENLKKLLDRLERNKLNGSGDNR